MWIDYIIGFAIAFVIAFVATPLVRKLAIKIGAIDVPKDDRRMHKEAIPLGGGLAIYLGIIFSLIFIYIVEIIEKDTSFFDTRMIGYLIGSVIIIVMGVLDDRKPIRAIYKLIIQIIAAVIAVGFGIRIGNVANPFVQETYINFNFLAIPITILWIVGITNAINFIDGLDGLATGISCISSLSLLFVFMITGQSPVAIYLAAIIVGATLGFLPFNFNPAKIFMGDTGSNFLGYSLGVLSIIGFAKTYTILSIIIPIIILAIPIFDTGFAIIRRLLKGQSPMKPDKGHLHHKLIAAGLSTKQAVFVLYAICVLLGMLAIVLIESSLWKAIVLVAAIILFMYAGMKYMGDKELRLLNEEKKDK